MAVHLVSGRVREREGRPDIELCGRLGHRLGLDDIKIHAPLVDDLVVEAGLRVVAFRR